MLRRTAAILATAAVLALGFGPAASAQDPDLDPYGAGAQATALQISLAGQLEAAFSVTGAIVTGEPPQAAANGAAALITGAAEDLTTAQTPGEPAEAQDCILDEELPAPLNLAGIDIACVDMTTNGDPSASSVSEELGLAVTAPDIIDEVVAAALAPILEQILGGLDPILAEIPGLSTTVDSLITTVLGNIEGGDTLATVSLAPTSSVAEEAAARGEARGIVVSLLPDLSVIGAVELPPLATITIGDAFADAHYDAATGEIVTDGKAAFLDVDLAGLEALVNILIPQVESLLDTALDALGLGDALGGLLGPILGPVFEGLQTLLNVLDTQIEDAINVTVDQLACNDSNPLAPVLCFTAGGVTELDAEAAAALGYDFGPGTRGVQAEVLDLALLSALGDSPLLGLRVGGASAAAAATPAAPEQPTTTTEPLPGDPGPLPRTGAESGLPAALALLAVAGLGVGLLRRTRTA